MTQKNDPIRASANARWQAAYWYLRLKDRRRLWASEGLRFLGWVGRSPEHLHEFLFLRRLDDRLTRLMRAKQGPSNVTQVDFWRGSSRSSPQRQARRRIGGWSVAATALVMLPVIFFLGGRSEEWPGGIVTTVAHELKIQQLEDGSEVSLGSDSTLRVQFTDRRRDVQLPHGNATFNVVMDMKRPFVVGTFLVDIAAVESTFSVSIDTSVEVMVYEGMVTISGRGTKAGAAVVTVKKGQTYRVPVDGLRTIVANGGTAARAQRVDG